MNEDFLHYVWKFQKFKSTQLQTTNQLSVQVLSVGQHNYNAGPDFFNAHVVIDAQKWVGTIEIHLQSSDWYVHAHEKDPAYDTVLLHVVWEHNATIYRKDGSVVPTLEIQSLVNNETLDNYRKLFSKQPKWIPCAPYFHETPTITIRHWLSRLYVERLEEKSNFLMKRLQELQGDWEALLFEMLAKNFGLKVNGASFLSIAQSISFRVFQKCRHDSLSLEALCMGQAGFFKKSEIDHYQQSIHHRYVFLKHKFNLENSSVIPPKFFRLRPSNFPTIRLSQLANLYHKRTRLFSDIINTQDVKELQDIFTISASPYWDTHYSFGVQSVSCKKRLTKPFIDLLIINTLLPIQFCYSKYFNKNNSDSIMHLAQELPKEKNTIITRFNTLKPIARTAFDSQALLQLKNNYCDKLKCLQCEIGNKIVGKRA